MSEKNPGRKTPDIEIAPQRYNKLQALLVTQKALGEFGADCDEVSYADGLTLTTVPLIEQALIDTEPVPRLRVRAVSRIESSLKEKRLTSDQYNIAASTLTSLAKGNEVLEELNIDPVLRYIKDREEDAKYYEKKIVPQQTIQGKAVTKSSREVDAREGKALRATRRRLRLEIAKLNTKIVLTHAVAAASSVGFFGGLLVAHDARQELKKLPAYAAPDERTKIVNDITGAIKDLEHPVTGSQQPAHAVELLKDAEHKLQGAGTAVTAPLEIVEKEIAKSHTGSPTSIDVYSSQRKALSNEIILVKGLDQSSAAKKYKETNDLKQTANVVAFISFFLGGGGEEGAKKLRRRKRKVQGKLEGLY